MERFVGQVAVVTGASGGIPSAIIKELLKKEVHVVGLDRNAETMKALEDEILKNKHVYLGKFYPKICDITSDKQVREIFEWLKTNLKTMAILINGAGVSGDPQRDLKSFDSLDFDCTFGVNVKGLLLCTKEALNLMPNNSIPGHIINICSKSVDTNYLAGEFSLYKATKHAVKSFSEDLQFKITKKRENIKVTNLRPGFVKTGLLPAPFQTYDVKQEIMEPKDIAKMCITILDTPPNVLISDITIEPIHALDFGKFY